MKRDRDVIARAIKQPVLSDLIQYTFPFYSSNSQTVSCRSIKVQVKSYKWNDEKITKGWMTVNAYWRTIMFVGALGLFNSVQLAYLYASETP